MACWQPIPLYNANICLCVDSSFTYNQVYIKPTIQPQAIIDAGFCTFQWFSLEVHLLRREAKQDESRELVSTVFQSIWHECGTDSSAAFLHRIDVWHHSVQTEIQLCTSGKHAQTAIIERSFLNYSGAYVNHGSIAASHAALPEGSKVIYMTVASVVFLYADIKLQIAFNKTKCNLGDHWKQWKSFSLYFCHKYITNKLTNHRFYFVFNCNKCLYFLKDVDNYINIYTVKIWKWSVNPNTLACFDIIFWHYSGLDWTTNIRTLL